MIKYVPKVYLFTLLRVFVILAVEFDNYLQVSIQPIFITNTIDYCLYTTSNPIWTSFHITINNTMIHFYNITWGDCDYPIGVTLGEMELLSLFVTSCLLVTNRLLSCSN